MAPSRDRLLVLAHALVQIDHRLLIDMDQAFSGPVQIKGAFALHGQEYQEGEQFAIQNCQDLSGFHSVFLWMLHPAGSSPCGVCQPSFVA